MNNDIYISLGEIQDQFEAFMNEIGVNPDGHIDFIADGDIHRFKTQEDKHGAKSGAYILHDDGYPAGFIQDFRKGIKQNWRFKTDKFSQEQTKIYNSKEYKEKVERRRKEREQELEKQHLQAAERARILYEELIRENEPVITHPYMKAKQINVGELQVQKSTGDLVVPLQNIDGRIMSLQFITKNGEKKFFPKSKTQGAFWFVGEYILPDEKKPILIGEGMATMCKIYSLTGNPCVAAMNCGNILRVATDFRKKYPNNKIFIMADNDKQTELETGHNPGLRAGQDAMDMKVADAVIAPQFKNPEDGTDWDDFAIKYGDPQAKKELLRNIKWYSMTDEEREKAKEEREARKKISSILMQLDFEKPVPPQEFIGGIFPRNFVSLIVAPPGTGKTMFMEKFVCDLSLGGNIFEGVAQKELPRKVLIFAGEAGSDMLVHRGVYFQWKNEKKNIAVINQHTSEIEEISFMLDDTEGWDNIERVVDMVKPDIVFFDTFSSFHDKDENKAKELKPIVRKLARLAYKKKIAIVLNHHTRKRMTRDRNLSLSQDDVIGSSVLNRLSALILGIEKDQDALDGDGKVLKVRSLKEWYQPFKPFNFSFGENIYGQPAILTDLEPKDVNRGKIAFLDYLVKTFQKGEWFSFAMLDLANIKPQVTTYQARKYLAEFIKAEKIEKRGETKNTQYSLK